MYIASADRWLANKMHLKYEDYSKAFEIRFDPDKAVEQAKRPESASDEYFYNLFLEQTSIVDYVWLLFRFDGEMAYLYWHDEWRVEDYE